MHQIGDEELSGTLKVRVMPSFASKWLLPRMPSFNQAYPGIQLEVEADLSTPNFNSDGVDLAISCAWTDNAKLSQLHLFDDLVYPVASADLLARLEIKDYGDLCQTILLHDSMPHAAYSTNWDAFSPGTAATISIPVEAAHFHGQTLCCRRLVMVRGSR